jgi:general secretion pathway protein E
MSDFIALLSKSGVQPADLEKAQAYQQKYGGRLEQILVNMGSLSSEALPTIYSELLGFSVLDLASAQRWDPPAVIDDYPLDFLVSRGWVVLEVQSDEKVVFATKSPLDLEVNDWLRDRVNPFGLRVVSEEIFGVLRGRLGRYNETQLTSGLDSVEEGRLRELATEAPTVNLLNTLLSRALRQGASDMHIEPQGGPARVRYRIDGVLHEIDTIPNYYAPQDFGRNGHRGAAASSRWQDRIASGRRRYRHSRLGLACYRWRECGFAFPAKVRSRVRHEGARSI